jgi:hypothetical protein
MLQITFYDSRLFQSLDLDVRTYILSCVYEQISLKFLSFTSSDFVYIIFVFQFATCKCL